MTRGKPGNRYYALRWAVLERDNFTCQYCGQHAPNVSLGIDYVTSVADGGEDSMENLKTSCYACNRGKSGPRIGQKRSKPFVLNIKPRRPLRWPLVLELLKDGPMHTNDIAARLHLDPNYTRVLLGRIVKMGNAVKVSKGTFAINKSSAVPGR